FARFSHTHDLPRTYHFPDAAHPVGSQALSLCDRGPTRQPRSTMATRWRGWGVACTGRRCQSKRHNFVRFWRGVRVAISLLWQCCVLAQVCGSNAARRMLAPRMVHILHPDIEYDDPAETRRK